MHPRLSLNFGLRYEVPGQQSQVIKSAPLGMVFPGDPGVPKTLVPPDKNNFAPRVGFAWTPFSDGRTSLRGAYGAFYETINADIVQFTASQPFRYNLGMPNSNLRSGATMGRITGANEARVIQFALKVLF